MVQNDETTALLSPARNGNGTMHTAIDLGDVVPIVAPYTPTSPTLKLPNEDLKAVHLSNNDVEPEPDWRVELKTLLTITVPVMFTYMLEYLPGLVCIMLVGHINSPKTKEFVDAATISTMFTNVTSLSVGYGLASALDTLCSQANGAGRRLNIGLYLQTCIIVVFGICLIPIFLLNWNAEWFLLRLGQDPEVSRLAGEFSRYTVFGVPCLFIYEILRKTMQAQSVVRPLVFIMLAGNCVNIFGGYYLTYHTDMGFHGAALSRTLGYATLPLCMVPYFSWVGIRMWWPGWRLREAWKHVGLFLHLGIPGFLMMAMQWWAYEVLAIFAGLLPNGVVSMSAHAVLMNVAGSLYTIYTGMAVSGNILVGNALGANMPKRAKLVSEVTLAMSIGMSFVVASVLFLYRSQVPKLLINDPIAIERASQLLLVMVPYEIVDAANCAMQGIYRGVGHQNLAALLIGVAFYVFGIPTAALSAFVLHWDVEGLWIGFGTGITVAFSACAYFLYHASWKQMAKEAQERTAH